MHYGIDYGLGSTNRDSATGIRYGVIPMNDLTEWAWESLEADYGEPTCPECGNEAVDSTAVANDGLGTDDDGKPIDREGYEQSGCGEYACDECRTLFDGDDAFGDEPIGHTLDDGEYKGTAGSDGDLFVLKSPYYTHAQYCSPCAPGACYLTSPTDKNGPRAYCLGHDWFQSKKAPYPVFRVSDGTLVKPE